MDRGRSGPTCSRSERERASGNVSRRAPEPKKPASTAGRSCRCSGCRLPKKRGASGSRWRIESCLEQAKGGFGLDEYEVRCWEAWHRHVTLSLLAHAFVGVVSLRETQKGDPQTTFCP